jgi:hypothetical protein
MKNVAVNTFLQNTFAGKIETKSKLATASRKHYNWGVIKREC